MEENFNMEWNMEENFSMEWNMEWKIFGMEWKKICSMENGKIVFHSIPYHALIATMFTSIGLGHTFWNNNTKVFLLTTSKSLAIRGKRSNNHMFFDDKNED